MLVNGFARQSREHEKSEVLWFSDVKAELMNGSGFDNSKVAGLIWKRFSIRVMKSRATELASSADRDN